MNTPSPAEPAADVQSPSHQEIAFRARALWLECGEPSGCDDEIWYEAERRLNAVQPLPRSGTSLLPPAPPTPVVAPRAPLSISRAETLRSRRELLSELAAISRPPIQQDIGVRAAARPDHASERFEHSGGSGAPNASVNHPAPPVSSHPPLPPHPTS